MNFGVLQQICLAGALQWHEARYMNMAPSMWGEPKRPNTVTNKTRWKKNRRKNQWIRK